MGASGAYLWAGCLWVEWAAVLIFFNWFVVRDLGKYVGN
jgi:hypothetical protein